MTQNSHIPQKLPWRDLQEATDADLVRQLGSGNGDAFAVIVDPYQGLVLSVALRIVTNQCEAEEVVQTVNEVKPSFRPTSVTGSGTSTMTVSTSSRTKAGTGFELIRPNEEDGKIDRVLMSLGGSQLMLNG